VSDLSQRVLVAVALIGLVVFGILFGKERPPPGSPPKLLARHRDPMVGADEAYRKFCQVVLQGRPVDGKGARDFFEVFRSIGFVPSVAPDLELALKLARHGDLERRTWATVLVYHSFHNVPVTTCRQLFEDLAKTPGNPHAGIARDYLMRFSGTSKATPASTVPTPKP
jgi:hypothetical protein